MQDIGIEADAGLALLELQTAQRHDMLGDCILPEKIIS